MVAVLSALLGFLYLSACASSNPLLPRGGRSLNLNVVDNGGLGWRMPFDFPDPSVIRGRDGRWYAFATEGNGRPIQVAYADDCFGQWHLLDHNPLEHSSWTSGRNTWAPDVRELNDGSYIMYFTGEVPNSHRHCIGIARSWDILGPYRPDPSPWICPWDQGGAIDASGFVDPGSGDRYVVYKVDGNSRGAPTPCGTGVDDPNMRTPIMLQRVGSDGSTKLGGPIEILNRVPHLDGALVEAPNLSRRRDGTYVLFYSSHCFQDPRYDVKYAYSDRIEGPYTRAGGPLLRAPYYGLRAPGGATSSVDEHGHEFLVFHGDCGDSRRCLYSAQYY
ncbi:unnamed protein product [Clonostachys byssicola]|uniref:Uncharacterized protein n=1 Tax=Clonostachys byssicola TaxID=160290 RepID=A0A9N9YBK5_9HYPO|nr:unnamed protein product [Clonostachys byssicola]